MTVRNIKKNLAGAEDLLHGIGVEAQSRGGAIYEMHKLDTYVPTYDVEEMKRSSLTFMRVYWTDTNYTDFRRNPVGTVGIASDLGGVWEVAGDSLKLRQLLARQAAEAGFNLVDGSFEEGANISGWPDVVWCQADGKYYQWSLDAAKTVAAGSTPTNIGTDWLDKSNVTFKDNLADPDSTVLIAGVTANDLIALLQDTLSNIPVNTQTGTTYTLVLSDYTNGSIIEMDNADANTVTIPPNSSVNFPVGAVIPIRQLGVGVTTIVAGSGVTLRNPHLTAKIAAQYGSATIHQRAANEWVLEGNIAAS